MEKSKRKEIEFQLRRDEILKQAERIFAAKGFYNATMAEIADASGFAIGTLYHFFDGKESLYGKIITEKLDRMYAEIREAVNGVEKVPDKIEMLVKSHFYFVANHADFCVLFISGEALNVSKADTALREKMIADFLSYLVFIEDIMRMGIEANVLRDMEPRVMASAFWGIIRSFIYDWMLVRQETSLTDKVGSVLDIFLKGVQAEVMI